jgi:hypothetical protein
MLFRREVLERIAAGWIDRVFRVWAKLPVRAGSTQRTWTGIIVIDSITAVTPEEIIDHDARHPGFADRAALLTRMLIQHPQRWASSARRELLDRILTMHTQTSEQILAEHESHVNGHRPHRELSYASPLRPIPDPVESDIKIIRRDPLGGLLHESPGRIAVTGLLDTHRLPSSTGMGSPKPYYSKLAFDNG